MIKQPVNSAKPTKSKSSPYPTVLSSRHQPITPGKNGLMKDLNFLYRIGTSKFPVYLVYSKANRQYYALKLYPIIDEELMDPSYTNESRMQFLNHQNVIKFHACIDQTNYEIEGKMIDASILLMELAPYGTFIDILNSTRFSDDEKLVRTYFRQLVDGVEYLHNQEIAHFDLKLGNLLLGENFKLKLLDFDGSYLNGDSKILYLTTKNYRGPETIVKNCKDPYKSDIYSMGVLLFILFMKKMPYDEDSIIEGEDLWSLMLDNDPKFWEHHKKLQNFPKEPSKEFKRLFFAMTKDNPKERISIEEIKESKWYNGPIYDKSELDRVMKRLLKNKRKLGK